MRKTPDRQINYTSILNAINNVEDADFRSCKVFSNFIVLNTLQLSSLPKHALGITLFCDSESVTRTTPKILAW